MKVLIVDDSDVARLILGDQMSDCGHQVVAEASTLKGALEAYRAHKPDLVTLDVSMPDADGLAVLKALRALDPSAKVLMVSGVSQPRIQEALAAAGACGILTKPVSTDELKEALARLVAP